MVKIFHPIMPVGIVVLTRRVYNFIQTDFIETIKSEL
jgi:hypothetical protein